MEPMNTLSKGTLIALGLFAVGVVTTVVLDLSGRDLEWTKLFYLAGGADGGWIYGRQQPWATLYDYGNIPTIILAVVAFPVYAISKLRRRETIESRACLVVVLTVILGPGLIVNAILKPHWGRPRPCEIRAFGGSSDYCRVWEPTLSTEGHSFTCGHCSMAFALSSGIAFYPVSPLFGVATLVGGVEYGVFMSLARIAQGGHFPSDALWSAIIVFMLIAVLYYRVFRVPDLCAGSRPVSDDHRREMMSPEIVLIVPISRSHYIVPPLGLGYLATALRRAGFEDVAILDCVKENYDASGLRQALVGMKPRVVGFQVFSSDYESVRQGIELAKGVLPEAVVIVGGPHISATAGQVLDDIPAVDYAFVGEAELGLPLLMRRLLRSDSIPLDEVPGLVWRENGSSRVNQRALVQDLDSLGFPAWDLMPPNTYPDAPQGAFYQQFPIAPMASTRGCPYSCTFCGSPVNMGNRLRFRSLTHVFEEMDLLRTKYGVREFHFVDDMFNASKSRVIEFCNTLRDKNWQISYTFPNGLRLNTIDGEMLIAMKSSGAYAFTVGIESGSPRILKAMNKQLTVDMIREKLNLISKTGLEPSGFFLIGFPGETREDMQMTLKFAKSLPIKRAHFSNFLPLPGTEATRLLMESGELQSIDWTKLAYSSVPYAPKGITKEELKAFQRRAFLEFHLRPKVLLKLLTEIRSVRHLGSILRRARDYLFNPVK